MVIGLGLGRLCGDLVFCMVCWVMCGVTVMNQMQVGGGMGCGVCPILINYVTWWSTQRGTSVTRWFCMGPV